MFRKLPLLSVSVWVVLSVYTVLSIHTVLSVYAILSIHTVLSVYTILSIHAILTVSGDFRMIHNTHISELAVQCGKGQTPIWLHIKNLHNPQCERSQNIS